MGSHCITHIYTNRLLSLHPCITMAPQKTNASQVGAEFLSNLWPVHLLMTLELDSVNLFCLNDFSPYSR